MRENLHNQTCEARGHDQSITASSSSTTKSMAKMSSPSVTVKYTKLFINEEFVDLVSGIYILNFSID